MFILNQYHYFQLTSASDVDELRSLAAKHCSLLVDSGYSKPLTTLTMADKISMVQTVTLHSVLLQTKAELDQFCSGLRALGVLDAIQEYSHLFRDFFTITGYQPLSAGAHCLEFITLYMSLLIIVLLTIYHTEVLRRMFSEVHYSSKGSNERSKEESTYLMFVDYLEEVEQQGS